MQSLIEYEYNETIPLRGEGKYIIYDVNMGGFISKIVCKGDKISKISLMINDRIIRSFVPKNDSVEIKLSPKYYHNTTSYFMLVYGDPHDTHQIFSKDTYVSLNKYQDVKLGIDFSEYVYNPDISLTYYCSNVEYELDGMKYLRFEGSNFPPIETKSGSLTKAIR